MTTRVMITISIMIVSMVSMRILVKKKMLNFWELDIFHYMISIHSQMRDADYITSENIKNAFSCSIDSYDLDIWNIHH